VAVAAQLLLPEQQQRQLSCHCQLSLRLLRQQLLLLRLQALACLALL
jgi:hypothetical protein